MEEPFVGGGFNPAPLWGGVPSGSCGRDSRTPRRRGGVSLGEKWVGSEGFEIPAQAVPWPPPYVPQTGKLCLAFPQGVGEAAM